MHRIGLVITNLVGGGAEKVVLYLAQMFQKRGIDAHIFLLEDYICYNVDGLKIHKLCKKKKKYKFLKSKGEKDLAVLLEKSIRKVEEDGIKFDVLMSSLPATDRIVSRVNLENNIYYIMHTAYSLEINEFKKKGQFLRALRRKRLYQKLYNDENLICVSQGICDDLEEIGIKPRFCKVIYNPFDIHMIQEEGEKSPKDLPDENYMVHVGAFRQEKRHDVLLEAYSKLINPPKLKLFCDYYEDLEKLIERFDLQEKVEIFGFRKNPYPYIKHAKLLILSSEREGLPTVLVEALVLKTPIVSTNCVSGPSEILVGELDQYLAKVNDSNDLSNKIKLALDRYPEIRDEYLDKFNEENIYNEYIKLFDLKTKGV
jgi:glycosyltransferase involved in cell wall biosynthesis